MVYLLDMFFFIPCLFELLGRLHDHELPAAQAWHPQHARQRQRGQEGRRDDLLRPQWHGEDDAAPRRHFKGREPYSEPTFCGFLGEFHGLNVFESVSKPSKRVEKVTMGTGSEVGGREPAAHRRRRARLDRQGCPSLAFQVDGGSFWADISLKWPVPYELLAILVVL